MKGKGSVGRSVGRRFHFVSLPACGGAIAAALCQSVTLSRHPFYYLAGGCPALSPSCQPWYTNPGTPFPTPPTGHGYNVDQARGCLTSCRARACSLLSFSVYSSISFSLAQTSDLHPQQEKTREAGGNAASGAAIRLYNKPKELEFQRETRFCILRATPVPVRAAPTHTAFR